MLAKWSAKLIDCVPGHIAAKRHLKRLREQLPNGYHLLELEHHFIRYRKAGTGKHHLVFAADPPVTLECYDQLIQQLSPHYRISVFELPGFGYSFPKSGFDFSFDQCVDDLAALLSHWRSGPYVLAFPCASAFFALALAQRAPHLVSHVVMMQVPDWQQEQHWKQRLDPKSLLQTPVLGQLLLKTSSDKIAHAWLAYASNSAPFTHQAQSLVSHQLRHGGCYCLASALQNSLPVQPPQLGLLSQPGMLVYGDQDRSHRKTDFNSIRHYSEYIQIQRITGAGHFPELENPSLFAGLIDAFLQRSSVHSVAIS